MWSPRPQGQKHPHSSWQIQWEGWGLEEGKGQLRSGHLGLLGVIGLDTYLHTPNADLKDAAGGWVKVHGEPAGGGNLGEGQGHIRCYLPSNQSLLNPGPGRLLLPLDPCPISPKRQCALAEGGAHKGSGSRYLLHSSAQDVIALVIGNLDRAQELHPELVHPVAVLGQGWKASMT